MAKPGPTAYQDPQIQLRAFSRPASGPNGDWWGWFRVRSRMAVFIADVAGRQERSPEVVTAAQLAVDGFRQELERNADLSRLTPSELIRLANAAVFGSGGSGEINMTFFAGVVDFDRRELAYANAGHCPPWLIAPRDGAPLHARLLASAGPRLGESGGNLTVEEHTLALQRGDTVVLYTDGLTSGKDGIGAGALAYGSKRPRQLIEAHDPNGDAALIDALLLDFAVFMGGRVPDDDLTVITLLTKF